MGCGIHFSGGPRKNAASGRLASWMSNISKLKPSSPATIQGHVSCRVLRENPEPWLSLLDVNERVVASSNPDQKRKACFLRDLKQVPGQPCQTNTPEKAAVVLHAWGATGKINGMRSNLTLAWCSCKTCKSSTKGKKHNRYIFLSLSLLHKRCWGIFFFIQCQ